VFWLCVPIATLFAAEQATLPARPRRPVTVVGFLVIRAAVLPSGKEDDRTGWPDRR